MVMRANALAEDVELAEPVGTELGQERAKNDCAKCSIIGTWTLAWSGTGDGMRR